MDHEGLKAFKGGYTIPGQPVFFSRGRGMANGYIYTT